MLRNEVNENCYVSIETHSNTHTITYKKGKYPFSNFQYMAVYFGLLMFIMLAVLKMLNIFTWLIFGILVPLAAYLMANYLRKDQSFTITDTVLILDNRSYIQKHIKCIECKDAKNYTKLIDIEKAVGEPGAVRIFRYGRTYDAYRSPLAFGVGKGLKSLGYVSFAAKNGITEQRYANNFSIVFRYDDKTIELAKQLTQAGAESLYNKVVELTGMQANGVNPRYITLYKK